MTKTLLFFTRHGAKEAKYKGIWTGQIDAELSEKGLQQAEYLGQELKKQGILPDVIISSTMKRAVDTAKGVQKGTEENIDLEAVTEFIEMTHGDVDGLTDDEFESRYPEILKAWDNCEDVRFPNGENFEDVEKRALPKLKSIIEKHKGKTILIIGHKSVNMVLIGALLHTAYPFRYIPQQDVCHLTLFMCNNGTVKMKFLNVHPAGLSDYKLSGYIE